MAYESGITKSRAYAAWSSMKQRCYNENSQRYDYYGGRGITVCDEWKNNFQAFYDWSLKNGYDKNAPRTECTIDRIDNDGNYCPENCQWTNMRTQIKNRGMFKNNTSGYTNISWYKRLNKWQVVVTINGTRRKIGNYSTIEDAIVAKKEAEKLSNDG